MADKISKYILIVIAMACLGVVTLTVIQRYPFLHYSWSDWIHYLSFYVLPLGLVASVLTFIAFYKKPIQLLTIIITASILIPFYAMEFYYQYNTYNDWGKVEKAAKEWGRKVDKRSAKEVVKQLLDDGVDASPHIGVLNDYRRVVPLGVAPDKHIVFCNELGSYLEFRSDRHGFNNPDSVWDHPVDVVTLGDSFTEGACDPDNKGFVNLLRKKIPNLVNLGLGGNAPQNNLAALKEYGVPANPKYVLWFHFAGNDMAGLHARWNHSILKKYVEDQNFTQGLINQSELVKKEFVRPTEKWLNKEENHLSVIDKINWNHLAKLYFVRQSLGQTHYVHDSDLFKRFAQVMTKAKEHTDTIGSRLIFVNIPDGRKLMMVKDIQKEKTFAVIKKLGIDCFDLAEVIMKNGREQNYSFGSHGGHFSPKGNKLAAHFVMNTIFAKKLVKK